MIYESLKESKSPLESAYYCVNVSALVSFKFFFSQISLSVSDLYFGSPQDFFSLYLSISLSLEEKKKKNLKVPNYTLSLSLSLSLFLPRFSTSHHWKLENKTNLLFFLLSFLPFRWWALVFFGYYWLFFLKHIQLLPF